MRKKLGLILSLSVVLLLALACGGGSGKNEDTSSQVQLRMKGGQAGDIVSAYLLEGGDAVASSAYDDVTGIAALSLSQDSSYRIKISMSGVTILEAIVLQADFSKSKNGILNIGAINGATTFSSWAHSASANFEANDTYKKELLSALVGMMIKSADSTTHTQENWNLIANAAKAVFELSGTDSFATIHAKAKILGEAIAENAFMRNGKITLADAGDLSNQLGEDDEAKLYYSQTGTAAGVLYFLGKMGLVSGEELLAQGNDSLQEANTHVADDVSYSGDEDDLFTQAQYDRYLKAQNCYQAGRWIMPASEELSFLSSLLRVSTMGIKLDREASNLYKSLHIKKFVNTLGVTDINVDALEFKPDFSTLPTMNEMERTLAEVFLSELNGAIKSLKSLSPSFTYTITKALQGGAATSDVEIDANDVKGIRAVFLLLKSKFEYMLAFDKNIQGKTDTPENTKKLFMDLDDGVKFTGSATYSFTENHLYTYSSSNGVSDSSLTETNVVQANIVLEGSYGDELFTTITDAAGVTHRIVLERYENDMYGYAKPTSRYATTTSTTEVYYSGYSDFFDLNGEVAEYCVRFYVEDSPVFEIKDSVTSLWDSESQRSVSTDYQLQVSLFVSSSNDGNYSEDTKTSYGTVALVSGALAPDLTRILSTEWNDILDASPLTGTIKASRMDSAKSAFKEASTLVREIFLNYRPAATSRDSSKRYHLVGTSSTDGLIDFLKKGSGSITIPEMKGLAAFLDGTVLALDGPSAVDASVFSIRFSTLPDAQKTLNLSHLFSKNPRDFFLDANGKMAVDGLGEIVETTPVAQTFLKTLAGGETLFNLGMSKIGDDFSRFGDYVEIFFDGLDAPYYLWQLDGTRISWGDEYNAESYNIYYASEPGITSSNYTTLDGGAKVSFADISTYSHSATLTDLGIQNTTNVYYLTITSAFEDQESAESMTFALSVSAGSILYFGTDFSAAEATFVPFSFSMTSTATTFSPTVTATSILWNLGSGNTSTSTSFSHVYPDSTSKTISASGTGLTSLDLGWNQLSTIDVSSLTNLTFLGLSSNQLSTVDVSSLTNLTELYLWDNQLSEAAVDAVLSDLVNHGQLNGTVNLSGGGTNAAPSSAGLANKAILEGRGWTVPVN